MSDKIWALITLIFNMLIYGFLIGFSVFEGIQGFDIVLFVFITVCVLIISAACIIEVLK